MHNIKYRLKKIYIVNFMLKVYSSIKYFFLTNYFINKIIKKYESSSVLSEQKFVSFCKKNKKLILEMTNGSFSPLLIFSDDYVIKYLKKSYAIHYFEDMPYVFYKNHKLFMPSEWNESQIISYIRGIEIEQDYNSPHCYFPQKLNFNGMVFVDIGGAEGNFAIEFIDELDTLYIFEADEKWIKPLMYTYQKWISKVKIIKEFVGDGSNNTICLDRYLNNCDRIDYIKMDVEGAESDVIRGASKIISKFHNLTLLICVYHYDEQESDVIKLLPNHDILFRKGKMFFPWDNRPIKQLLRNGVIEARAKKSSIE